MYLITPNPAKEEFKLDLIWTTKDKHELEYYVMECAKQSKSHTACVWRMTEEHIGKFKEFKIDGFEYRENGEVLPK